MSKLDLTYRAILNLFGDFAAKGRTESRALLAWFLENFHRLEAIEVDDSICDKSYDRGVDGIYVNDQLEEIDVFQAEIAKTDKALGDTSLKEFAGTLAQFRDGDAVRHLQSTTQNPELAAILQRLEVGKKIDQGYEVRGVFITNKTRNKDAIDLLPHIPNIALFDRIELERMYVPIDKAEPISDEISFDISTVPLVRYPIDATLEMVIAPLAASELVKMEGIISQELFAWNLRYRLKRSKVNIDIAKSIRTQEEHKYFPAFHNGLTILCERLDVTSDKITVAGYAVVNGCQSLTGLYENQSKITSDLRIWTKFINVSPRSELASKITDHTNNQNAITGRDRKSNNSLQTRLQSEIHRKYKGEIYYRIARGEHPEWEQDKVIENELAARMLLSFDLEQPESSHQHYKLFDDLHSDIFGRPQVNADRVVFLNDIDQVILTQRPIMEYKLFAHYGLTRFLFHYLLREALETDPLGRELCANPSSFLSVPDGRLRIKHAVEPIVKALMRFVDAELKRREQSGAPFDYKKDLKSPTKMAELRSVIIPHYQISVDAKFGPSFSDEWQKSETVFATLTSASTP